MTQLVGRLKAVVEGSGSPAPSMPPPSTPSPAVAAAEPMVSTAPAGAPCRVFVTEQMVNPSLYTVVKRIKYAKKYSAAPPMRGPGWRAKLEVDADAVVAVNINFRPSGFSWASPHAEGIAVKWNDEGRQQFHLLGGPVLRPAGEVAPAQLFRARDLLRPAAAVLRPCRRSRRSSTSASASAPPM